jgi:Integrase core domain
VSWFTNLFDARRKVASWQTEYNEQRPHSTELLPSLHVWLEPRAMEKTWASPTWKTPLAFPTFPQLRRRDRFTELPVRT